MTGVRFGKLMLELNCGVEEERGKVKMDVGRLWGENKARDVVNGVAYPASPHSLHVTPVAVTPSQADPRDLRHVQVAMYGGQQRSIPPSMANDVSVSIVR